MENIDADEEIILTGSPEVDINILVNLDIKSLNKFCLTSQYAQELCSDDYFWVFLHHIDDNSYTILIYTYEYLQSPLLVSHRVELTKQWDYKETLRFLTAAQRYIKPGTQIKINDEAAYPLKIDQNWLDNLEQTKPQLYNAHMKFLIKRVAIWDTLEYLEPK